MKPLVAFTAIGLLALPTAAAGQETLTGAATVIDGDTIAVRGVVIRIEGIDAPEWGQVCLDADQPFDCGRRAKRALIKIIAERSVECAVSSDDRHGRALATCFTERIGTLRDSRIDIADELVRQGWALAYRRYSISYVPAEREARAQHRGLWAEGIAFTEPWEWRRQQR